MKNWIGFVAAMLVAVGLGILGTTPPRPLPADAAQTEFSASRAMAHVRRVAARPHPTGSAENAAVRSYIAEQLRGLGLEVREAEAALPQAAIDRMALLSKGALVPEKLVNVIGVLPGKNRAAPAVALMTHHDTVWGSPGAADDTAGVATILETLRAIKASGQPARDLVVVITDAEELGLSGAEAFFAASAASAASITRAPPRMPGRAWLPSWQAYSYSGLPSGRNSYSPPHGFSHIVGSSTVKA